MRRSNDERGAALLTVLLLTGTLAALALVMTELMGRAVANAGAAEARDQAFWAMRGGETAALGFLRDNTDLLSNPLGALFLRPVVVPLEGAELTMAFAEESNCFNINDLVDGDEGVFVADEAAADRFSDLVRALGGTKVGGEQMAARIADFIDSDARALPGGAEDFDYQRRKVPYRTAGVPLASVSEIRAIEGFSRDVYRALAPHLCALPSSEPQQINVNTLTMDDVTLVLSLAGGAISPGAARALIENRPRGGYQDVADFLTAPQLSNVDLPDDFASYFNTKSTVLGLVITLKTPNGQFQQKSLLTQGLAGYEIRERTLGDPFQ